ncbi:hypothetical protein FG386_003698 [Cryptosporidium ryanae]|uniref:uncharacterized protein n=1 Tax=Cryptosporidium ryanae TaxID=515981 RepID=UPI00351A0385|nr:hypothetical protein FG386_003698 [Cryptosporidium ryanae]
MGGKEFVLKFEEVRRSVSEKIKSNKEYLPKIEFLEHICSYSTPAISVASNSEKGENLHFDTLIVPALPRSLKTERGLKNLCCRFSYSNKPCSISPPTHYGILSDIFKYEVPNEVRIYADRFCLRKLIDYSLGAPGSGSQDILISAAISISDDGNLISNDYINLIPINIKEGFPSVGFQFETFLTKNEIQIGPNPSAALKLVDSCLVIDKISIGDFKLIRRCEIDAVRRSHVFGDSVYRTEQDEHRDTLRCENWDEVFIETPSSNMDKRLNPPAKLIISDNLKSSKIVPDHRVEIKSISCRNTHNFSWTSVYFQMLLGCTPTLIRGCHNRGFFQRGSISSYHISRVKEYSDKEPLYSQECIGDDLLKNSSLDKNTLAIAFSEAILEYICEDLIKDKIPSYIYSSLGPRNHFVNVTLGKRDEELVFCLLDNKKDTLPDISGPINNWVSHCSKS